MNEILLTLTIGAAAALYSSVGHGGASAYIALLTLAGKLRPEVAATILLMNIRGVEPDLVPLSPKRLF